MGGGGQVATSLYYATERLTGVLEAAGLPPTGPVNKSWPSNPRLCVCPLVCALGLCIHWSSVCVT